MNIQNLATNLLNQLPQEVSKHQIKPGKGIIEGTFFEKQTIPNQSPTIQSLVRSIEPMAISGFTRNCLSVSSKLQREAIPYQDIDNVMSMWILQEAYTS